MKTIWLAGATLMIGASVYGIINYEKTSNKKEFKNMYTDKPMAVPSGNNTTSTVPGPNKNTMIPVAEKKKTGNKISKLVKTDKIIEVKTDKPVTQSTDKPVVTKRKFSTRLFSRAPLDERYISPEKPSDSTKKTDTHQ